MRSTPITPDLVRGAVELEPTEHGLLPTASPPGRAPSSPTGASSTGRRTPPGSRSPTSSIPMRRPTG